MAKIQIGDLFEIKTPKGKAYLHYIHRDSVTGELVRVLQGLHVEKPDLEQLAALDERYMISFPLSAAAKRKIVERVGYYSSESFSKPKFMRTSFIVREEFLGWHLVDTETWQRQLVKDLSHEQRGFSPWGIWNDTLLINRLIDDWSLEKWS